MDAKQTKKMLIHFIGIFSPLIISSIGILKKKQQQQMSSDQYKFYLDRIDDDIYHALLNDDDNYE